MSVDEVLELARAHRVVVRLNSTGDGLELEADRDPPPDLVALLRDAKPGIVARLETERRQVNHWIANHLINWDPGFCLGCRKRIVSPPFIDVVNGEARARFHADCLPKWRAEQEIAARRTIGLGPAPTTARGD